MRYRCLPYVMRFARYQESPYRSLYINIARWCNQPAMFKKTTLREFARMKGEKSSYMKSILDFERKNPEMAYYLDDGTETDRLSETEGL